MPGAVLLKAGYTFTQPDVWIVGEEPDRRVWKTFRATPPWARRSVGAWLARREARNIRQLDGMANVPRLIGMPEPWTVEMSYLPSEPVREDKRESGIGPEYFIRLEAMIAEMHRRGMNHGDLRRKNLLRDPVTGEPCLVDFAQSLIARNPDSLFGRIVLRRAFHVDRIKLLKLKRWYLGKQALAPGEQQEIDQVPFHLRFGRFLRREVYRPFKHWRQGRTKAQRLAAKREKKARKRASRPAP